MSCYRFLAPWYDKLTGDVPYGDFADFYEAEFRHSGGEFKLLLDLCCGTGTLTCELARRGYEMIAVDASVEMLMEAQAKSAGMETPPLFLCQDAAELDLYGTVEACICCLDSLNYLTRARDVQRTFARLKYFIAPGGVLIFDVHAPQKLEALDAQVFLDERDDVYCVWRTEYRKRAKTLDYYVDIFRLCDGGVWERSFEEHHQRAYTVEELTQWLKAAGFTEIRTHGDMKLRRPDEGEGRIYFSCIRK